MLISSSVKEMVQALPMSGLEGLSLLPFRSGLDFSLLPEEDLIKELKVYFEEVNKKRRAKRNSKVHYPYSQTKQLSTSDYYFKVFIKYCLQESRMLSVETSTKRDTQTYYSIRNAYEPIKTFQERHKQVADELLQEFERQELKRKRAKKVREIAKSQLSKDTTYIELGKEYTQKKWDESQLTMELVKLTSETMEAEHEYAKRCKAEIEEKRQKEENIIKAQQQAVDEERAKLPFYRIFKERQLMWKSLDLGMKLLENNSKYTSLQTKMHNEYHLDATCASFYKKKAEKQLILEQLRTEMKKIDQKLRQMENQAIGTYEESLNELLDNQPGMSL